jgi:hypothetical protein
MTVVSLGVTAIHKCRSMSNTGRCLLWSALRTQVRRRARQRQRLTQNQWRAMQERERHSPLFLFRLWTGCLIDIKRLRRVGFAMRPYELRHDHYTRNRLLDHVYALRAVARSVRLAITPSL